MSFVMRSKPEWSRGAPDSDLNTWKRRFGSRLLGTMEFREWLSTIAAGHVPGSGPSAAMQRLRDKAISLYEKAMSRKLVSMEPPCGHALMFMALLDHGNTAVAAAALAALACCIDSGNTAQARLMLAAAPVLSEFGIRNGKVAAAATAAKPDAVPTIVLQAALPLTLPHLEGPRISDESVLRSLQALAPSAAGAARHAAACAAAVNPKSMPQAEVLPPELVLQLAAAGHLLDAVCMHAPEAVQPAEMLLAALDCLQQLAARIRQPGGPHSPEHNNPGTGAASAGQQMTAADLQRHPLLFAATTRALHVADITAAMLMAAASAAADSSSAAGGDSGSAIGSSAAEQQHSAEVAAAQAVTTSTPGIATRALRVLGELCAIAVASCTMAAGSGSAAAEQLLQGGQEGLVLLRASLAAARPVAKWQLGRCLARLTRPAVLQHLSPQLTLQLASVLAQTAEQLNYGVPPAALTAAEVAAARWERLTTPTGVLSHALAALQDAEWEMGSDGEICGASDVNERRHLRQLTVCATAMAAVQQLSTAVLQAACNPSLLHGCGGGGGGSGSNADRERTHSSGEAGFHLDADANAPRVSSCSGGGGSGVAAGTSCGTDNADASGCGPPARSAGSHVAVSSQAPAPETPGAGSLALASSGALAALTSVLQQDDDITVYLSAAGHARAAEMAGEWREYRMGMEFKAAYNALATSAGLLEAEMAAGWAPPDAIVALHVQVVLAMLQWTHAQSTHSQADEENAWRCAHTACDFLAGLASAPASAAAAAAALADPDNHVASRMQHLLLVLLKEKQAAGSQNAPLLENALWLLATSAAGDAERRNPGAISTWDETAAELRRALGKRRPRTAMQWVDAAFHSGTALPPLVRPAVAADPQPDAEPQQLTRSNSAADAAMRALLAEEEGGQGAAATGPPQSKAAKKRAQRRKAAATK